MKRAGITVVVAAAAALAIPAAPASAQPDDLVGQGPNPSADFGLAGSAQKKLAAVNGFFGTNYINVGKFVSGHVRDEIYSGAGPGRSGLAPNSSKANSHANPPR
jgi:hypothetical protein